MAILDFLTNNNARKKFFENSTTSYRNSINTATDIINKRINRIPDIDEKTLKMLRFRARKLMINKTRAIHGIDKYQDKAMDLIYDFVAQTSSSKFGKWMGDHTTNALHEDNPNMPIMGHSNRQAYKNFGNFNSLRAGIDSKINALYAKIKGYKTPAEVENILKEEQELENLIQQFKAAFPLDSNAMDFSRERKTILDEMREIVAASEYFASLQNISGAFGETLAAFCDDRLRNLEGKTDAEILKILRENIEGADTSNIIIKKSDFMGEGSNETFNSEKGFSNSFKKVLSNDVYSFSLGATKDKVDVSIEVGDEPVNASIKAYDFSSQKNRTGSSGKVTIQSDTNLLNTLIFLERSSRFGSHWALIHTKRFKQYYKQDKDKSQWKEYKEDIEEVDEDNFQLYRERIALDGAKKEIDELLRKEMAYEALVKGNPLKKKVKAADSLVTIDLSTGEVYVFSTKKVLTEPEYLKYITSSPDVKDILLNYKDNFLFKKQFQKGGKKQLNVVDDGYKTVRESLIMQAHHKNLHFYFGVEALSKVYKI